MTKDERRREDRLERLEKDVRDAKETAKIVAERAILGEVRFVESLVERRRHKRGFRMERRGI